MKERGGPKVFLIQLGDQGRKKSLGFMELFRLNSISVAESLGKDSIKAQLKISDKLGCELTVIIGQKEALDGTALIREMKSGIQEVILQKDIVEIIKAKLKRGE